MKNTDITVILAFKNSDKYNQLLQDEKIELVTDITEHIGGYRMDNGTNAIEYSYTLELFDVDPQQARDYFITLGKQNNQESVIFNGDFIYM